MRRRRAIEPYPNDEHTGRSDQQCSANPAPADWLLAFSGLLLLHSRTYRAAILFFFDSFLLSRCQHGLLLSGWHTTSSCSGIFKSGNSLGVPAKQLLCRGSCLAIRTRLHACV